MVKFVVIELNKPDEQTVLALNESVCDLVIYDTSNTDNQSAA